MYTQAPEEGTLRAQAYTKLKYGLLNGDFPINRRLVEGALADQLEVSRTPVREALSRLHAEGLVTRLPEGGFAPAAPDLHSISELYEIRRALEFGALHRSGHDHSRLNDVRAEWTELRNTTPETECGPEFVLKDESFHINLAAAAGNRNLVDMLNGVNERIRIVRMHDFLTADRVQKTIEEHLAIVSHLLTSGPDKAGEALGEHLKISEQVVEQRAARAISRMIARQEP